MTMRAFVLNLGCCECFGVSSAFCGSRHSFRLRGIGNAADTEVIQENLKQGLEILEEELARFEALLREKNLLN